jgi:rhodanese-related sulfurtransferase
MPARIERNEVRRLIGEEDAQLVEVLPRSEHERLHIAGAMSLPLKELDARSASVLDRHRPVIVYCHDYL